MTISLDPKERAILLKVAIRPKKLKRYYQARAILALNKGLTPEQVAKRYRLKPQEVINLSRSFESRRSEFLAQFAIASKDRQDFERDLDYVLEKNQELYRRLAQ
ncbi:hypothetical protein BH23PLA1_BH23PLA1_01850 [soil metagenome]